MGLRCFPGTSYMRGMPLTSESSPPVSASDQKRQQTVRARMFWFLTGSVVNYLFISTPFHYLKAHTGLSLAAISACSIGLSTSFFFVWNYFVNFRGNSRRRDALLRYVIAVFGMWVCSSLTLTLLKSVNFHCSLSLGALPVDLDIVATQLFLGGFKFLVYHFWVFPTGKTQTQEPTA